LVRRGQQLVVHQPEREAAAMARCRLLRAGAAGGEAESSSDDEHICMDCGKFFANAAGVACHRTRVHGTGAGTAVKPFIASSICPACRIRIVQHVRPRTDSSNVCRAAVLSGAFPQVPEAILRAADVADRLARKSCRAAGLDPLASEGLARRLAVVESVAVHR
jgi:hypothetical protein